MFPIWFGPDDRPLAGFIHPPRGQCRGGAVICAPFGYEATCAYRSLRELADRLADAGILVLRFDYYGTGASSGSDVEPDLVDRWHDSVTDGIAEMRRRGVSTPALIGLRLGAALAYSGAARDGECGPVVLWEPVASGRRFYRELKALAAVTPGGQAAGDQLQVAGHIVPESLAAWTSWHGEAIRSEVLVIQTPGRPAVVSGPNTQVVEIPGTADALERSAEEAELPTAILAAICDWVSVRAAGPAELRAVAAQSRALVASPDITEEFVRIGTGGLHGVLVGRSGKDSGSGVVFLNNGAAPAAGPGRAWVEFSRALAEDGITSLRLDFTGLGDSPDTSRRRRKQPNTDPPTAGVEVVTAAEFLRARGVRDITVVGLCSGAQIAVRTAAYASGINRVLAINPPLFYLPNIGIGPMVGKLWQLSAPLMGRGRIRRLIRLPEAGWTVLDAARIFPSPVRFLSRAADHGTKVRLVFADDDRGLLDIQARASKSLGRQLAADRAALDVVPGMDHSMFARAQRKEVLGILRAFCGADRPVPNRLLT